MLSLAWRNLFQKPTQVFLGVGGVALALLLMIALDALFAGSENDLAVFIEQSGADVFVSQEGVKNFHMASSAITRNDVRLAAQAEGVLTTSAILYTTSVIQTDDADVLSYIIGFNPNEALGGPQGVIAGKATVQRDEIIIDAAVARTQNIWLGDEVDIFGESFTIVGITEGLTNIVNSVAFIHFRDFEELRGGNVVSYGLLQVAPGYNADEVARAIEERDDDVTALSRSHFSSEERQIVRDMSAEILGLMNIAGFLIGLAVMGFSLYTSTLSKAKEYGVLKAIGAKNIHLYTVVTAQAFISLVIGFAVAIGFVWGLGYILPALVPGVSVILTPVGAGRVLIASIVIGLISALAPAVQIARLDPADVFRG